jgi:hypothetical protein
MKVSRKLLLMLAVTLTPGLFVLVYFVRQMVGAPQQDLILSHSAAPTPEAASGSNDDSSKEAVLSKKAAPLRTEQVWQTFKAQFGEDLQAQFDSDGRLDSVKGSTSGSKKAGSAFRSDEPQQAIARAREILEASAGLLGIQSDLPLERPRAQGDRISAQVTFRETKNAIPILPDGVVIVDLGSQGELLGLYSSYVPDIKIVNQIRLSADEARKQAISSVLSPVGLKPEGGGEVIWVTKSTVPPSGYRAYEFEVQGHQVVVNAESGEILFKRNRGRN